MAWEEVDVPGPLIAARCRHCYRLVAKYYPGRDQLVGVTGWVTEGRGHCVCEPRPALPTGDELAVLIGRAERQTRRTSTIRAPLQIRV